jgi:hypothetical protein
VTALSEFPAPLRPLAARVLAKISPFYLPPSLSGLLGTAIARERRNITALTRDWTPGHWEALSAKLSTAVARVSVSNGAEAMVHVEVEAVVEGIVFRAYDRGNGRSPGTSPVAGSLRLSPATLRVAVREVTDQIRQDESQRRACVVVDQMIRDERALGRRLEDENAATLTAARRRHEKLRQQVATAATVSAECNAAIADARRALQRARARAAALAKHGARQVDEFEALQESRRRFTASASLAEPAAAARIEQFDAACARALQDLDELCKAAADFDQTIDNHQAKQRTARARHRKEAETSFETARAEATRLAAELRDIARTLGRKSEAEPHWRRIDALLNGHAIDRPVVDERLRGLRLWQLGTAPELEKKQKAQETARQQAEAIERDLSVWSRPICTSDAG